MIPLNYTSGSSFLPVVSELASLPQALHGIAYVLSLTLHGRSDHNPHNRARHPAVWLIRLQ